MEQGLAEDGYAYTIKVGDETRSQFGSDRARNCGKRLCGELAVGGSAGAPFLSLFLYGKSSQPSHKRYPLASPTKIGNFRRYKIREPG
jgi:hypothetical protein